jgi:hypothetical protein
VPVIASAAANPGWSRRSSDFALAAEWVGGARIRTAHVPRARWRSPRVLVVIGMVAAAITGALWFWPVPSEPQIAAGLLPVAAGDETAPAAPSTAPPPSLTMAADELTAAVDPASPGNEYFPGFARESLAWLYREVRAGRLAIVLLERLDNTNLHSNILMASGVVDGRPAILVPHRRFAEFLADAAHGRIHKKTAQ